MASSRAALRTSLEPWPASAAEDAKITTSMRRGASAVVTGLSSRETTTEDTFSLLGFTAAVDDAGQRCK